MSRPWTLAWGGMAAALCTLAVFCAASAVLDGSLAALAAAAYSLRQAVRS